MIHRTPFPRTFLDASLPAWLVLALVMFLARGDVGLPGLLAILFPGLWGVLRLHEPAGAWPRRLGYYFAFCLVLGAGVAAVLFAALFTVRSFGLHSGEISNLPGKLLLFVLLPGASFLVMRGALALPGAVRFGGWRSCIVRTAGLVLFLAALGGGGYWWASQPYRGHASWREPQVLTTSVLADLDQGAAGWRVAGAPHPPLVEDGALHLAPPITTTLFYTAAWHVQPGDLPRGDGFRLWARGEAATTLTAELQEVGGGRYRAWADLPAGGWHPLFLTRFLPSLDALDENGRLDWKQVERVTLYVYLEAAGSGLWVEGIEALALDPGGGSPWLEAQSEHFWIRYHPADEVVVADVVEAAEGPFERITALLGYRPAGRVPITVVSTHAELEEQVGGVRPAWVHGSALPDSLVLLTPRRFSPLFNGHRYEDLFELLPHELTHLLVAQIVGYPGVRGMPHWLNEGLATYLAGEAGEERAPGDAAWQGKPPSLPELERAFRGQAPIGDSYSLAGSITGYLIEIYGPGSIPPLLAALAGGADFDAALQQVAGINADTLEQLWRERLVAGSP